MPTPEATIDARNTELAIDLVRGIAALLVFVSHVSGPALGVAFGGDSNSWPMFWRVAGAFLCSAPLWVRLFFVISGFCIHQSILRASKAGTLDWFGYALARLTRIYPIYLVSLALAVAAFIMRPAIPEVSFPSKELVAALVMLQQILGTFPGFGPSWSLTSEAIYYIAFPLALMACRNSQRPAVLWSLFLSLASTAAIVVVWKLVCGGDRTHWLIPWWVVTGLYLVWLSGAWLSLEWEGVQKWLTPRRWKWGLVWSLVVFLIYVSLFFKRPSHYWPFMAADYLSVPGFVILLAGGRYLRLSSSVKWAAFARWMGVFSYPCYLLHCPIIELLKVAMRPFGLDSHPGLQSVILFTLTFAIVGTVGVALERFFMKRRSVFLKGRAKLPSPLLSVTTPQA